MTPTKTLHDKLIDARQYAAIATAFTLPFSTSGQAIAISVFVVLALATLDRDRFINVMRSPAAWLPVALFALIVVGVAWSPLPAPAAAKWISPYAKLLLIPLMLATAFSKRQALQIGYAFVASCAIIMAISYASLLWPMGQYVKMAGIPFKDNAVQSECFAFCALGLALGAMKIWKFGDHRRAIAMATLAILFFANIFMIYISKTGALVALSLLGLFLLHVEGWRRIAMISAPVLIIAIVALSFSQTAQLRVAEITTDITAQQTGGSETVSTASRIDFWKKAGEFVAASPVIGHGTGSIRSLYQALESSRPSPYGEAVADPHNQVLHTVLQVGMIGGALLLAMWAAHLWMFAGRSDLASVLGFGFVVFVFVGSLFNSHISQVTQGMLYCLGVGLCGSLTLKRTSAVAPQLNAAAPI